MNQKLTFESLPLAVSQLADKLNDIEQLLLKGTLTPKHEVAERLLTVQEAAKFLTLSVPTIYSKVSKGELPVMKRGKRLYFSQVELMDYLKGGRKKTNSEIESEAESYLMPKR